MSLIDQSQVSTVYGIQQINGSVQAVGAETPTIDELDEFGNVFRCHGTVVPTDNTPGYAKPSWFNKSDAGAGTNGLYVNVGTTLLCQFVAVDTAVGGPIPLANGKTFEGVGGVATAKTLTVPFAGTPATISPTASSSTPTSSAPTLTMGGAAITASLSGFTGTTTSKVTTITSGGATIAAHALAGGVLTDGTTETLILDNSALTSTSGTITTVTGLASTITATGAAYQRTGTVSAPTISTPTITVTGASYTPAGTNTVTYT